MKRFKQYALSMASIIALALTACTNEGEIPEPEATVPQMLTIGYNKQHTVNINITQSIN